MRPGTGSPPRAWGQFCGAHARAGRRRFTPTGVGTMLRAVAITRLPSTVHPHGRGDNVGAPASDARLRGSPPRAWGQFGMGRGVADTAGFTPTGVGTITAPSTPASRNAVHPHGRGDNAAYSGLYRCGDGSPPRAWGQSRRRRRGLPSPRFTPTGVGTMLRVSAICRHRSVYPHGRGDNNIPRGEGDDLDGSPPRAWGQCCGARGGCVRHRFTPTGVGTIRPDPRTMKAMTVHPHGRGDNEGERRRG